MHRLFLALTCAALAVTSAACISPPSSKDSKKSDAPVGTPWVLTSTDFAGGAAIPADFTCDGGDFGSGTNPELEWTDGPDGTASYAAVLKDVSIIAKMRDDPADPRTLSHGYHWAIWDIPAATRQIPHDLGDEEFPAAVAGARQWSLRNPFGYFGPCPNPDPAADPSARATDHYTFTLYALPTETLDAPDFDTAQPNYVQTLDDTLKTAGTKTLELLFTSDAASASPPEMLDPSAIEPPTGISETDSSATSGTPAP